MAAEVGYVVETAESVSQSIALTHICAGEALSTVSFFCFLWRDKYYRTETY